MSIFYPIQIFADLIAYDLLGLSHDELLGEVVNYFIFDTVKIFILLAVVIFAVSVVRTFLAPTKIRTFLAGHNKFVGHIIAAATGIITPFCSCSAVPLFLGFVEAGVPLGITFSFLIASPMINEVALVMLLGSFGLKVALIYITSGLVIAVAAGMVIGRLNVENLIEDLGKNTVRDADMTHMTWNERMHYAYKYTWDIIVKVGAYIILGVAVGAWIHGYVPADFLAQYASADKWYAVPLATLVGIPLYANAAGVMPIVSALFEKGVALGTVLAFMMAVTALSLPEFLILRRIMKPKLIAIFATVVGAGIIFIGYLFNTMNL
ncbi:MAG: permease [Parcubacteria group bacterium]|jgi:hypothetical protein